MLTRMRDLVRFQGRVRRLPALYAISLWAAGVIEFVGALVLLFVYSAISKAGAETTNQDAVYEELSSSLFGGEVAKTILNALLVPGTLLVVGGYRLRYRFVYWSSIRREVQNAPEVSSR